jgi:hypothetical protein
LQQQHNLGRQQLSAFENRAAVKRVDALAGSAAVDWQATATVGPEQTRVGQAGLTMWTAKPARMEVLLDPGDARLSIE